LKGDDYKPNEIPEGLIEGKCTPKGTKKFAERAFNDRDISLRNFRKPILEDS
jgi:hypothetical protein